MATTTDTVASDLFNWHWFQNDDLPDESPESNQDMLQYQNDTLSTTGHSNESGLGGTSHEASEIIILVIIIVAILSCCFCLFWL